MPLATQQIETTADAPGLARHWVMDLVRSWRRGSAETAGLLTSELVADAVRRESSHVEIRVRLEHDALRVDVGDGDGGLIPVGADDDLERSVRRRLVDGLARSWGSDGGRDRTEAWFELAA